MAALWRYGVMAFSGGLALWRYGVMNFEEDLSSWCYGVMALYSLTNRLFCPVKSIKNFRRGAELLGKLEMTSTGVLACSMVFEHDLVGGKLGDFTFRNATADPCHHI